MSYLVCYSDLNDTLFKWYSNIQMLEKNCAYAWNSSGQMVGWRSRDEQVLNFSKKIKVQFWLNVKKLLWVILKV